MIVLLIDNSKVCDGATYSDVISILSLMKIHEFGYEGQVRT